MEFLNASLFLIGLLITSFTIPKIIALIIRTNTLQHNNLYQLLLVINYIGLALMSSIFIF